MRSSLNCMVIATGLGIALISLPVGVNGGIKCWTNKDGLRECGNIVPPEYAQKSHQKLNEQGLLIEEKPRAKTPEEIEQEQAAARRRAAEEAKVAEMAREQAKRDRVLLHTFTAEEDMYLARDGKLQAIEARVQHAKSRIIKLEQSLEALRTRAAQHERRGNSVSEELQQEILAGQREIKDKQALIELLRAEQQDVRATFEADLQRFRELKGSGKPSS